MNFHFNHDKNLFLSKIFRFRYRFIALLILFISLFVWQADNFGVPNTVSHGYNFEKTNALAKKIDYSSDANQSSQEISEIIYRYGKDGVVEKSFIDGGNKLITNNELLAYFSSGFIFSAPVVDFITKDSNISNNTVQNNSLNDIIPPPTRPQNRNLLIYQGSGYEIRAPLVYSTLDDLYNRNSLGEIDYRSPKDSSSQNSSIQIKLKDGVVHMANTPTPGELGNSYIVGHSSNYSNVPSAYNEIFKPLMFKSKPGDSFVIYDSVGRKLEFRVFEALEIRAEDLATAYSVDRFKDKRVVTLQTSVLTQQGVNWVATHRWLTRGELVLD